MVGKTSGRLLRGSKPYRWKNKCMEETCLGGGILRGLTFDYIHRCVEVIETYTITRPDTAAMHAGRLMLEAHHPIR